MLLSCPPKPIFGDVVIHSAAQTDDHKSVADPFLITRISILGSFNVIKSCVENCIRFYTATYCGIGHIILRHGKVYKPSQDSCGEVGWASIFTKILNGKNITIFGDGKQTRNYIYISDVVNANIKSTFVNELVRL